MKKPITCGEAAGIAELELGPVLRVLVGEKLPMTLQCELAVIVI